MFVETQALQFGSCIFDHNTTGLLALAPNSHHNLALVLMGNSLAGLEDIISLATPTIPPMTRSPVRININPFKSVYFYILVFHNFAVF